MRAPATAGRLRVKARLAGFGNAASTPVPRALRVAVGTPVVKVAVVAAAGFPPQLPPTDTV